MADAHPGHFMSALDWLVVDGGDPTAWVDDAYLTGMFGAWVVAGLALLGYLVFASDPDGEDAFAFVFGGMLFGVAWPLIVAGGLAAATVFGLRAIVHGQLLAVVRQRSTRVGRRDARIAALEAENARLERELGLDDA